MGQAAGRTRHRPLRALAAWRLTSWIARPGWPGSPGARAGRPRRARHLTDLGAREPRPRPAVANLPVRAASPGTRTRPAGGRHLIGPGTVLLLTDPADKLVPLRAARQLAATLPDARLQLVEGAGHQLPRRGGRRCWRSPGLPMQTAAISVCLRNWSGGRERSGHPPHKAARISRPGTGRRTRVPPDQRPTSTHLLTVEAHGVDPAHGTQPQHDFLSFALLLAHARGAAYDRRSYFAVWPLGPRRTVVLLSFGGQHCPARALYGQDGPVAEGWSRSGRKGVGGR
jgi:hypothetical protein